jgi:hypothetical protein
MMIDEQARGGQEVGRKQRDVEARMEQLKRMRQWRKLIDDVYLAER